MAGDRELVKNPNELPPGCAYERGVLRVRERSGRWRTATQEECRAVANMLEASRLQDIHWFERERRKLPAVDQAADNRKQRRPMACKHGNPVYKCPDCLREPTRSTIVLDDRDWQEFVRRLDDPPEPNKALRVLLRRKPVWER